jgi:hypothetical protein
MSYIFRKVEHGVWIERSETYRNRLTQDGVRLSPLPILHKNSQLKQQNCLGKPTAVFLPYVYGVKF